MLIRRNEFHPSYITGPAVHHSRPSCRIRLLWDIVLTHKNTPTVAMFNLTAGAREKLLLHQPQQEGTVPLLISH